MPSAGHAAYPRPYFDSLRKRAYRVLAASRGPEALALSRRHGDAVDLVVTDVVMPRMTGFELAHRLREEHPGLPVLFMSGQEGEDPSGAGAPPRGTVTLRKPFTPAALLQQIGDLLEKG